MATDLNKMAAQKPDASVLPPKVKCPAPENFKGCKCQKLKCNDRYCICYKNEKQCTSKCKCLRCQNKFGVNERATMDLNMKPVSWCTCPLSECLNKYCQCFKDSHGCSPKCECRDCRNPKGVRGSEPEQPDDTSSKAREPPHMVTRGATHASYSASSAAPPPAGARRKYCNVHSC